MSASREKNRRRQDKASGVTKGKQPSVAPSIIRRVIIIAVVAVVAVTLITLLLVGAGVPQQAITALKIEGVSVSAAEMEYYYNYTLDDMLQYVGSYIDTSNSMKKVASPFDQSVSMADYTMQYAIQSLRSEIHWYNIAVASGASLTEEDKYVLESSFADLEDTAAGQGVSTEKLLRSYFGRGMTVATMRKVMERQFLVSRYQKDHSDSITFTDSETEAYYLEHRDDFDLANYRQFSVDKSAPPKAADYTEEELKATLTSEFGEITFEASLALEDAKKLASDTSLTADNFNELAALLVPEDKREPYEDPNYTLQKCQTYTSTDDVKAWIFDSSRKAGDVTVISTSSQFVVLLYLDKFQFATPSSQLRVVYYNSAEDAQKAYTGKLATPSSMTRDEFIALVKSDSQNAASRFNDGIVKDYVAAAVPAADSLDEWATDSARKDGDIFLSGVALLRFESFGRASYLVNAESKMRSAAMDEWQKEKDPDADQVKYPSVGWFADRLINYH